MDSSVVIADTSVVRWVWNILLIIVASVVILGASYIAIEFNDAARQRQTNYDYQPARNPSLPIAVRGQPPSQPYQPNCQQPQTQPDAELCAQWASVDQSSENNRLASVNVILALWMMMLSIVGTFALVLTFWDQRRTTRRELRAYVFPDAMGISGNRDKITPPTKRGKVGGYVVIKNSGQTPAFKVAHWGSIELLPVDEESKATAPRFKMAHSGAIAPNGAMQKFLEYGRRLNRAEIADFKAGKLAFYIFGRIEYEDTFGRRHFTEYRFHYTGRWPVPEGGIMNFCLDGNHAD